MAEVTTIIGDTIRLQGHLQGDEDLTVLGRVDGTIELSQTLIVEPSGVVKADVTVQNAIISGVVVGNIQASDSVEITKEGRMVGDIATPRVILVDGASFRGEIDMGDLDLPRAQTGSSVKPRSRPRASAVPNRAAREPEVVAKPEAVAEEAPKARTPARKTEIRSKSTSSTKKAATAPPKAVAMRGKKRRVSIKKR